MADHSWRVGCVIAGGLGLGMVLAHWVAYYRASPEERRVPFNKTQMWGSGLSLVVYGSLLIASFDPWGAGIYILASLCVWLILSGSFEAWWLLEPKGLPSSPGQ
jgi:hypothetical protein